MSRPELSIVIPTRDRPALLARAIESALAQTLSEIEVLVVDDGSRSPPALPNDPRLRSIRLSESVGGSAARNIGAREAAGTWLGFLDDDDEWLPEMGQRSLERIERSDLPRPVAALSALEVVNHDGAVLERRLPPSMPRGSHYSLERPQKGRSWHVKQTLIAPTSVFLEIGGFEERLRSRVHTELFWRLNPVCSLAGFDEVTYRLHAHPGERVSRDVHLRTESFRRLTECHRDLLRAHPAGFADLLIRESRSSLELGEHRRALGLALRALRVDRDVVVAEAKSTLAVKLRGAGPERL